jgi:hypothetical protein
VDTTYAGQFHLVVRAAYWRSGSPIVLDIARRSWTVTLIILGTFRSHLHGIQRSDMTQDQKERTAENETKVVYRILGQY